MLDWLNQAITILGLNTSPLEVFGFLAGAICVYLNTRQNVLGWFFGIINSILYTYVFWQVQLYADMSLQAYYFITSIYGWWMWLYGGKRHDGVSVSNTPRALYLLFAFLFFGGTMLWGYLLGNFTNASLSYLDSALTIASLIAQWMMARKYIENWLIWIVADVFYTGLYWYKGLELTSILYLVFTLLAISGYYQWKRDIKPAVAT